MEMFNTGLTCSLPDLPDKRKLHTMSGLTICGGYNTRTNCLMFSEGQWNVSHSLVQERYAHSSWLSRKGLVLIGGYGSGYTSELVGQGEAFSLKYNTV